MYVQMLHVHTHNTPYHVIMTETKHSHLHCSNYVHPMGADTGFKQWRIWHTHNAHTSTTEHNKHWHPSPNIHTHKWHIKYTHTEHTHILRTYTPTAHPYTHPHRTCTLTHPVCAHTHTQNTHNTDPGQGGELWPKQCWLKNHIRLLVLCLQGLRHLPNTCLTLTRPCHTIAGASTTTVTTTTTAARLHSGAGLTHTGTAVGAGVRLPAVAAPISATGGSSHRVGGTQVQHRLFGRGTGRGGGEGGGWWGGGRVQLGALGLGCGRVAVVLLLGVDAAQHLLRVGEVHIWLAPHLGVRALLPEARVVEVVVGEVVRGHGRLDVVGVCRRWGLQRLGAGAGGQDVWVGGVWVEGLVGQAVVEPIVTGGLQAVGYWVGASAVRCRDFLRGRWRRHRWWG